MPPPDDLANHDPGDPRVTGGRDGGKPPARLRGAASLTGAIAVRLGEEGADVAINYDHLVI
jgi:hypothetical protein